MFEGFEKKGPSSPLPSWLGAVAWRVEKIKSLFSGKAPMITKETIRLSQNKYTYLNQKSIDQLNYTYNPLEDSIKETAIALKYSLEKGLNHSHLPLI